jgi:HEAT repeat protein
MSMLQILAVVGCLVFVQTTLSAQPTPSPADGTFRSLVEELKDPSWTTRTSAAERLGELGGAAESGVPQLIGAWETAAALDDPLRDSQRLIRACRDALAKIGPSSVTPLVENYRREGQSLRQREDIMQTLERLGQQHGGDALEPAVSMLREALSDGQYRIVAGALRALQQAGPQAKPAVPDLEGILGQVPADDRFALTLKKLMAARILLGLTDRKHEAAQDFLRRYHIDMFLIEAAIANSDAGDLRALCLISAGADVNAVYVPNFSCHVAHAGYTALMHAASRGNILLVETLLKAGADASIERDGKTALDLAQQAGQTAIVELLMQSQ